MRRQIMATVVKKITQAFKKALGFCIFGAVALSYLAMAAILFYPVLKSGLYLAHDFLAGAYPPCEIVRTGLLSWFNPYIYGGTQVLRLEHLQPIMAIFNWLVPASHFSISVIFFHVWLAGIGMFLFLRAGLDDRAAWFGGTAYMFTGMICSLVFAGHDGKIMVSAYLPWLFWCIDNIVLSGRWRWAIAAGLIGGLAATTFHVQMVYYVLIFCLIYYAFRFTKKSTLLVLAALAISGVMFVPTYLAVRGQAAGSTRASGRDYATAASYSMPPEEIFCIAEPGIKGEQHEYWGRRGLKQHTEYMGWLVVVLMVIGLFKKWKLRWPMVSIGLVSLAFAFGGYTPLYKLIYHIPPNGAFRSPGMAFIGFAFAGVVLAAGAVNRVKAPIWLMVLLTLFTAGDLGLAMKKYIRPVTFDQIYGNTEDVAKYLQGMPGDFRIWPADQEINDNRWGYYKLKSIGGNYPMPRAAFVDSVGRAPGAITPDYHRMTLQRMREMNVRYVITKEFIMGNKAVRPVYLGKYGYTIYKIGE